MVDACEAVARAVVEDFEDTGNADHNLEETRDRFIEQWVSELEPSSRLEPLIAIDGIHTNDLVTVPHAEDRFTAKIVGKSVEVIRSIGEHISYVKDLVGGPETSFDEGFAANLDELIDGPLKMLSTELSSKVQLLADPQQTAEDGEPDK